VDVVNPVCESSPASEFLKLDLTDWDRCLDAVEGMDYVFALAASVGQKDRAETSRDNTLINTHTLEAARAHGVQRVLFASSSLVYPLSNGGSPLAESEAGGDTGWDDLSMERLCRKYRKDFRLETRIARLHNVYGPLCIYDDQSSTSPAAVCRRIAEAYSGDIFEISGDGRQLYSYTYVHDCIEGLLRVMRGSFAGPLNIASPQTIAFRELVDTVAGIAGKSLRKEYSLGRQPSSGRVLTNELARQKLLWEPGTPLVEGLRQTYRWIEQELGYEGRLPRVRSAVA
jgi:nucleoside-diphosphate-sugar epimerase